MVAMEWNPTRCFIISVIIYIISLHSAPTQPVTASHFVLIHFVWLLAGGVDMGGVDCEDQSGRLDD